MKLGGVSFVFGAVVLPIHVQQLQHQHGSGVGFIGLGLRCVVFRVAPKAVISRAITVHEHLDRDNE